MVSGHGATHCGKVRRHNEDGMLVEDRLGLFAVADGMGGHNAGEVASALALESLDGFLERSNQDRELTWPFGIESTLDYNGNRLRTAVKLANRRVFRESESRDQYTGMGTTLAVVLADGPCATICGVGDSRVYLVRAGNIERLTQDHTWVETLLAQNPTMSRASLADHPMRHVLTKVIGGQDDVEVTITSRPLVAGDRFVICSDGVHGALDEARIAQIVRSAADTKSAADRLVAEALDLDGEDNLTAVVAGVSG
ncbi:MAG TPA: protein phosphatase 2C domain-containing protein [Vicinamibacterales bacterium]|jgi:protein phosphatase|nr:protein phosphatase 2C domain-containing protein [Vicinamibacterales bacterium]